MVCANSIRRHICPLARVGCYIYVIFVFVALSFLLFTVYQYQMLK